MFLLFFFFFLVFVVGLLVLIRFYLNPEDILATSAPHLDGL